MIENKKAYLQISFGWLFAIIVGITIIFLAIYFVVKVINLEETAHSAKTSQEVGILLNPLETSFESAVTSSFTFPEETQIHNRCDNYSNFGLQRIEVRQKDFNKWVETNIEAQFQNKYIFSEKYIQGRTFYIFSKPFKFPFKIADLIYLTPASKNYCFVNAPTDIEDELEDLNQPNLRIREGCSEDDILVCFNYGNCDIFVNYNAKRVEKNNKEVYFEGDALMYAAIFSDKEIYECQLQRLMKRNLQLSSLYMNKANYLAIKGCSPVLNPYLAQLINSLSNFENSEELYFLRSLVQEIDNKNVGKCRLW